MGKQFEAAGSLLTVNANFSPGVATGIIIGNTKWEVELSIAQNLYMTEAVKVPFTIVTKDGMTTKSGNVTAFRVF